MTVPKYAQEMMQRASFDVSHHPKRSPGYTIRIEKATPYTRAASLRAECEKLCAWARRNYADAEILDCPEDTHYCRQYATVTIYDPAMQQLEKYIPAQF